MQQFQLLETAYNLHKFSASRLIYKKIKIKCDKKCGFVEMLKCYLC